MDSHAKSFVAIMIVIAICALLLRFAVEALIKRSIEQNEFSASLTMKLVSTALENYAMDNHGVFPANLSILTQTTPAYIDKEYIVKSPVKGYNFGCSRLDASGYRCSVSPVKCKLTGKKIYTITTGGFLSSEECDKKE